TGHEPEAFGDLAALLLDKTRLRPSVFNAALQIDRKHWPAGQATALVNAIIAYASSLPAEQRTTPSALDALKLGDDLAVLLPKDEAEHARSMLQNLGVSI